MNLEELRLKALLTLTLKREKDKTAQVRPLLSGPEMENINLSLGNVTTTTATENMVSFEGVVSINSINVNNDKDEDKDKDKDNDKDKDKDKDKEDITTISADDIKDSGGREEGEISDYSESEVEEGELEYLNLNSQNRVQNYQIRSKNKSKNQISGNGFGYEENKWKRRRKSVSMISSSSSSSSDRWSSNDWYTVKDDMMEYNCRDYNGNSYNGSKNHYHYHYNNNINNTSTTFNTTKSRRYRKSDFAPTDSADSDFSDSDIEKLPKSEYLDFTALHSYKSTLLCKLDETQVLSSSSEQSEKELLEKLSELKRIQGKCELKRIRLERELSRVEGGIKRLEATESDITKISSSTTTYDTDDITTTSKTTHSILSHRYYLSSLDTFKLSSLYKHFLTPQNLSSFSFNHRPISPNIPFCSIELLDGYCNFSTSSYSYSHSHDHIHGWESACPFQHFSNLRFETFEEVIDHFVSLGVDRLKLEQFKETFQKNMSINININSTVVSTTDQNQNQNHRDVYSFINFILYSYTV